MTDATPLLELDHVLFAAAVIGAVARRLGLPAILAYLLVGEEPSFPISDAQGANHPVPREERHGEHGAVGRVRQTVPDLWGERDPRIDEDIRRRERPALTNS